MANMNNTATINVAVKGVEALNQLQTKLGGLTAGFDRLKGALAGIAVGAFIANAFQAANALTDMAKASNISTQALLGFRDAIAANGGEAQNAVDAMGKFSQAIDSAANGSAEMQDRLLQLGITLSDLRSLSEEQLLQKVIQGLGQGESSANKMAVAMSIFGKSFRAVDFKGVASDIRETTAAAGEAAAGYDAAGETQQRFSNSIIILQRELLKALTPISELAASILESSESIGRFIRTAIQIGLVVATFTLLGKAIQAIKIGIVALAAGWEALTGFIAVGANGVRNFALIFEQLGLLSLRGKLMAVGELLGQLGTWAVKSIPGLGALGVAFLTLIGWIKDAYGWTGKLTGLWAQQEEISKKQSDAEKAKAAAAKEAARAVEDAFNKQRLALQQIAEEYNKQNKQLADNINLENSLIGKTKEYTDVAKAQEDIFKRAADASDKLRDSKEKLTDAEKRAGLGGVIDQQIAKVQELAAAEAERVKGALENQNRLQGLEQLRQFGIKSEIELSNQLQEVQNNIAKSTMTVMEKKYYDIEAAAKAAAKAGIEAEQARIGRALTAEEAKKYYDTALKGAADLKAAADEEYQASRRFNTGWKSAFNDYVENATNAAMQAQNIFQSFTKSMEDSLYSFFKTGKFGFKDMIQTMVDTLLRSQIQQLMAKVMSVGSSGGGSSNFLGSLLGFANGGVIPTNGPVIVGERGPEVLSGVGGRTVTPNSALGGTTVVNYNISAVDAMSFKSMIARDPSFIHAVAMQGARTVPGRI